MKLKLARGPHTMGKITGFLEYQRLQEAAEDKESRKQHYLH